MPDRNQKSVQVVAEEAQVNTLNGCEDSFIRKNGSLYYLTGKKLQFLSTDLEVTAFARDNKGKKWGRMLRFSDMDGTIHDHYFSTQDLGKDGDKIIAELRDMGLQTTTEYGLLRKLATYVYYAVPQNDKKIRCTDKTGWHEEGSVYLLSDNTAIGESLEDYAFQSSSTVVHPCSRRGSLDEWKQNIAELCRGNSRLMFVVSMSFASGLLGVINAEGGGFNLFGRSSGGKTTALNVAASIMGRPKHYIQPWRATDNGLEGVAKLYNDSLLILDELGELDPSKAGQCAYMLANGGGKIRANATGNARQCAKWLLMFLSSAEITLAEHMAESGKVAKAGQETRFADIPADAGKGLGIFEELHGIDKPATFADTLKQNTEKYHGTAFPAFIEAIIERKEDLPSVVKCFREDFLSKYVPSNISGQIHRVASRFALVAVAGEIATDCGITGWEKGEAEQAVVKCFFDWLNNRSHTEDQEDVRIVATFKAYFQQYHESRFTSAKYDAHGVLNAMDNRRTPIRSDGFKIIKPNDEIDFYVFPESFNEICSGLNRATAIKFLAENGYILKDSQGRNQPQKRLPEMGQTRIFHFTPQIMTD